MSREKQIKEMEQIGSRLPCDGEDCSKCLAMNRRCNDFLFAERLYNAGYRKQEWISAEKPPEIYRDEYDELIPFLVCCKGTVYPFRAVYDGTNWGDGIGKLKVAYWMPLPEPPKMKGGAE